MDKLKIEFRRRALPSESINDSHYSFLEGVSELDSPWNLGKLETLADIGSDLTLSVSLNKALGRGLKGDLVYTYRGSEYIRDTAQYDDNIFIEFSPDKISLETIINILRVYVPAFNCYKVVVHNWAIVRTDWPSIVERCEDSGKDVNGRDGVYRINAINYFDRELCQRAFNLSPEQIIERLDGKVESVSLLHDGVLLIYSSKYLERDKLEKIDSEIRPLLA